MKTHLTNTKSNRNKRDYVSELNFYSRAFLKMKEVRPKVSGREERKLGRCQIKKKKKRWNTPKCHQTMWNYGIKTFYPKDCLLLSTSIKIKLQITGHIFLWQKHRVLSHTVLGEAKSTTHEATSYMDTRTPDNRIPLQQLQTLRTLAIYQGKWKEHWLKKIPFLVNGRSLEILDSQLLDLIMGTWHFPWQTL